MSLDVCPGTSVLDVLNLATPDAELLRNGALGDSAIEAVSDSPNIVDGQFCCRVGDTTVVGCGSTSLAQAIAPVVASGSQPEMIGPNTGWVVAVVQDVQPVGNRSVRKLPGVTMGCTNVTVGDTEAAVAFHGGGGPHPAVIGLVDLGPEASLRVHEPYLTRDGWPGQKNLNAERRAWRPWHR